MKNRFLHVCLPLLLVLLLVCSSCQLFSPPAQSELPVSLEDLPEYTGKAYVAVNGNIPYFTDAEKTAARNSYETYGELDSLGRCTVCVASVGKDLMPTEARGSIGSVKPTGWPEKVEDAKYDIVDGKYLYNRCHLIGFQLTGENANKQNLITGTRYLNIEGMLPFEDLTADYVKETGNHVLYRVTPVFDQKDLVALGVLMEGYSVEDRGDGVLFCVFCYNVQPGIVINYATGNSRLAKEGESLMPGWHGATLLASDPDPVPEPEEQSPQKEEPKLILLQGGESVAQGEAATVSVKGEAGVAYSIQVKLPSGKVSSASALVEQTANGEGIVTWTWNIASNTKPGIATAVVTGGGQTLEFTFSIVEK